MLRFNIISQKKWECDLSALLISFLSNTFENIKIQTHATRNVSGHYFVTPFAFNLSSGESFTIPTGIRMLTDQQVWLLSMPRNGRGCKYRFQLDNTTRKADGDDWESDNEGHIFSKLKNDGKDGKTLELEVRERFMQGVILPLGKADDYDVQAPRNGGHGSTGK